MLNITDTTAVDAARRALQQYRGRFDAPTIFQIESCMSTGKLTAADFDNLYKTVQQADPRNTDLIGTLQKYSNYQPPAAPDHPVNHAKDPEPQAAAAAPKKRVAKKKRGAKPAKAKRQ